MPVNDPTKPGQPQPDPPIPCAASNPIEAGDAHGTFIEQVIEQVKEVAEVIFSHAKDQPAPGSEK